MDDTPVMLDVDSVTKHFPGVLAVDGVSFSLRKGEVLALLGENGAGKSTLTQVISGVVRPDSGTLHLDGSPVSFASPADAIRAGVSTVFQELSLMGSLSVAENIFVNRQPTGPAGKVRWGELYRNTSDFLRKFSLDINPRTLVKRLSMGQRQMLEILKALSTAPKVLLLDEPTSSLTEAETAQFFDIIRGLKAQGTSFIYITHKMTEVFEIADEVMVMRDGKFIDKKPVADVTEQMLITMMVGRKIEQIYGEEERPAIGSELFGVENFERRGVFHDVSFSLRRGEVLGFAGLVGAGRTELARAIVGADHKDGGRVTLDGRTLHIARPQDAIEHKIAYLTEDRKGLGLFLEMSVAENVAANRLSDFASRLGFMRRGAIEGYATTVVDEFRVATPSTRQKVLNLSGGNQQKCLVALWMGIEPEVIILDEPTRGVDVGARMEIYQKVRECAAGGAGVILISSDLPELIGMCDRILVMHHGRISGEVERESFSEERILAYAAGVDPGS